MIRRLRAQFNIVASVLWSCQAVTATRLRPVILYLRLMHLRLSFCQVDEIFHRLGLQLLALFLEALTS